MLDAERCSVMERFEELNGTLNGRPAIISGRRLDFPHVLTLDGSGIRAEFAWETLRHCVKVGRVNLKA